jgi:hypothetical protein
VGLGVEGPGPAAALAFNVQDSGVEGRGGVLTNNKQGCRDMKHRPASLLY